PKLSDIPTEIAKAAKIMFLNYPNNPTGATATPEFFQEVVAFAREFNILICHDAPYTEIAFDGFKPISFLQTPGAKEVGIEFHSVSKTYNMTGWRIGWAAGNAQAIDALGRLKSNIDSGQFQALQYAAMEALTGDQSIIEENNRIYQERRDILVDGLNEIGWNLAKPKATIYIWAPVPSGYTSASFAELVLDKAGVVITPGSGYGPAGSGYFRMSLTLPTERLKEAIERIKNLGSFEF
ncbi:MAG: aminotransferase class I/II-fold pyridoxal phosphate-dependent enzyme, partial [Clostridia bacterium]|nr:aminotransferase class I/II-fold pyridoxal phosphate-dependent enzyme [Clostridia bacterium]